MADDALSLIAKRLQLANPGKSFEQCFAAIAKSADGARLYNASRRDYANVAQLGADVEDEEEDDDDGEAPITKLNSAASRIASEERISFGKACTEACKHNPETYRRHRRGG